MLLPNNLKQSTRNWYGSMLRCMWGVWEHQNVPWRQLPSGNRLWPINGVLLIQASVGCAEGERLVSQRVLAEFLWEAWDTGDTLWTLGTLPVHISQLTERKSELVKIVDQAERGRIRTCRVELKSVQKKCEALERFELSISCLLDRRFNQLSHSARRCEKIETEQFNSQTKKKKKLDHDFFEPLNLSVDVDKRTKRLGAGIRAEEEKRQYINRVWKE